MVSRSRNFAGVSLLAAALVLSLVAGATAGLVAAEWRIGPRLERLSMLISATSTPSIPEPAETPDIEIIPLERRPLTSAYPQVFANRMESGALVLVRRGSKTNEPLALERRLGVAVALTTDGWLLSSEQAIAGLRLADIGAVYGGEVAAIERGYRDRSTGFVYLKITAQGLPVTTVVRPADVLPGSAVWVEGDPMRLRPESMVDVRLSPSVQPISSERAARRFLVSGPLSDGWHGAPVWDGAGRLLGLLEGWGDAEQAWRVMPVGSVGRDLGSILSSGEIRRATLGVRAYDLGATAFEARPEALPKLGAWLQSVSANGPTAKLLREGDVIERIERDILDGTADLGERLLEYRPGATVSILGRRSGAAFSVNAVLGNSVTSESIK